MKFETVSTLKQIDFRFRAGGGWFSRQVDLARLADLAGLAGLAVLADLINLIDLDGMAFEIARARAYNGGVLGTPCLEHWFVRGAPASTAAPGCRPAGRMDREEDRLAEVAGLLQEALCAGLLGAEWASGKGFRWLAEAYNGIGPEFFGEDLRKKTSRWFAIFKPAALIHDARNHVSDGTRLSFYNANIEFHFNCLLLADRAYPWWNWKRYRARLVADALYDFVSSPAGWKAWLEAHEKFVNRKEKT